MASIGGALLAPAYAVAAVLAARRVVRLARESLAEEVVVNRTRVAVLVGAAVVIAGTLQLAAPARDLNLLLGSLAAFAGAVAFGTGRRPLDFLDANVRDSLFRDLPQESRPSKRRILMTQLKVIMLFLAGAAVAAVITYLAG